MLVVILSCASLSPFFSLAWAVMAAITRISWPAIRLLVLKMAESERPFGVLAAAAYAIAAVLWSVTALIR
jgi:hypothetical protein